jgi:hypothetical protein
MRARRRISLTALLLILLAAVVLAAPAYSASNHQAVGRGTTNQFLCPNGVLVPATIDFQATKNKGTVSGFFSIFGGANKFGSITDGTINSGSYTLTGVVQPFSSCAGASTMLPAQATISGQCGEGVTIHYRDTHGEVGDFLGNVFCS